MSCLSSSSSSINHVQFNSDLLNSLSSSMDWQAWLSKTFLRPSLAREYAGLFSDNLLEEEDIEHFDHAFLLSMGIVVGKHRLEILKLARKKRTGLSSVMNKFGGRVKNYIRTVAQSGGSAIVAFPKVAGRYYWASNGMSRRKVGKEERLMITNGKEGGGGNEGVRWDYMFQDLKPT